MRVWNGEKKKTNNVFLSDPSLIGDVEMVKLDANLLVGFKNNLSI